MRRIPVSIFVVGGFFFLLDPGPLFGQVDYDDSGNPWKHQAKKGPDKPVGGWYYNLGITGMRGMLLKDKPSQLLVKYVFPGTPATGKIQVGDRIIGANGRRFVTPHKDGYGVDVFGGEGPLRDFAQALQRSQGKTLHGKLTLLVLRNGKSRKVKLAVGKEYGTYSATFPFKCQKSDRVFKELCRYLAKHQGTDGSWGAPHLDTFAPLALLASGNRKYRSAVEKNVKMHARTTKAIDKGWLINWRYMAAAIVMSEYYLSTRKKWVLPELREVYEFLLSTQYMQPAQIEKSARDRKLPKSPKQGLGGWGHNPGYEGYGPISMITAQGALALALMHHAGIEVNRRRLDLAYDFLARGTGKNGYVWYGDQVSNHQKWADMGRTGTAALALALSPYRDRKYRTRALAHARMIGAKPETLPDTHGAPIMGMGYTALGAFVHQESFRDMMDNNRWWFTLAQCPDGTFYYQPNRDNNPGDFTTRARISASAVVAFIFAAAKRNLRITGAKK